ncbi:ABC-type transport system involved in cytochrome c biogenesis ATPase subunit [Bradyrhizobium sp. USDA 4518]
MDDADRNALKAMLAARKFDPYISHIRFPHYKNLAPDLKIDFDFPVTALVGANGTNKSSILRAIQGSPGNENLGVYWFSTSTDPIADTGARNAFIYGYHHSGAGKVVEVLKLRIKKNEDPDYWEPSRALASYGMAKFDGPNAQNKNKTRWDTITKPVIYVDFRQTLSAFDRAFYYGTKEQGQTFRDRKNFLRKRSPRLAEAIKLGATSYSFHGERIVGNVNRLLTDEELKFACSILDRDYSEIQWVRHRFFNVNGATCVLRTSDISYTEAFAGSGEFAVVRLVVALARAKPGSLILLDEPEVSLHPGAQERLMKFLFARVKKLKHQVVLATHSAGIIRWLPPEAIKVLVVDPSTGKVVLPSQASAAEEAFFHIGEPIAGKTTVIVEDELAKHIVIKAIKRGGASFASRFSVKFYPGGSQTLWSSYLPVFSAEARSDVLVLLDGDRKPSAELPDPEQVAEAGSEQLRETLNGYAGVKIKFGVDGGAEGGNKVQVSAAVRGLVKWAREHVDYLPGTIPEAFVWDNMAKTAETAEFDGMPDPKKRFDDLARKELDRGSFESVSSQDILATQLRRLATVPPDHPDLVRLHERLVKAAASGG